MSALYTLKFSAPIPRLRVIRDREKFLEELVKGKVVLHGGCVDSGVLMERINAGEFLHDRLLKTANRVRNQIDEGIRLL